MNHDPNAKPLSAQIWLQAALIIAAGWFVYSPALQGTFLWDDRIDIVENILLRTPDGLWKIWTQPALLYDFYPIKHTVQWVQWQLWGDNTLGYHVTNLALHLLGAFLFWRVLRQLGLRLAWLGALLFTVHPIAVESVAWIAELKNTLSLPPLLLSFSAFIAYSERGRRADYLGAMGWFLGSMLCKTGAVTFPVFLVIFLWWKRGRLVPRDAATLTPFFLVSIVLGLVTMWFQHHRAIGDATFEVGGLAARVALAGTTLAFYLGKCVWPAGLLPIYPRWAIEPPSWWQFLPWLVFGIGLAWLCTTRAKWSRHVLIGLGWFGLMLAPFVGAITISYMLYSWVMDHFAYVPLLGIIALALAALEVAPARALTTAGTLAICGLLAWLARSHAGLFRNEETLWAHTTLHNPSAWVAHYNLALQQGARGDTAAARLSNATALRLEPNYAPAHNNLGKLQRDAGENPEARRSFEAALRCNPTLADAHSNLGDLLRELGDTAEATRHVETALRLEPGNAPAWNNCGLVLAATGQTEAAARAFEEALRLAPGNFEAHNNLGSLLSRMDRLADAERHFLAALRLKPNSPAVLFNLGNLQRKSGRLPESITSYERALRLEPTLAVAHRNLAISLRELGRAAEARAAYAEARRLDPTLPAWPY
jgi:tetratricopeptide (TPR) repeat protein